MKTTCLKMILRDIKMIVINWSMILLIRYVIKLMDIEKKQTLNSLIYMKK